MKKPTLRFRQVFEHPTHFKVVKPLGNPLLIAKKGLSPGMQSRLRKFAQGGEVRGYDDGGLVTDPGLEFRKSLVDEQDPKAREQKIKEFIARSQELPAQATTASEPVTLAELPPLGAPDVAPAGPAPVAVGGPYVPTAPAAPVAEPRPALPAKGVLAPGSLLAPGAGLQPVIAKVATPLPEAPSLSPQALPRPVLQPEPATLGLSALASPVPASLQSKLPGATPEPAAPEPMPAEPEAAAESLPIDEETASQEQKPKDIMAQMASELPKLYRAFEVAESNLSARRELIAADEMKAVQRRVDSAREARDKAWNEYQSAAANEKPYLSRGDALSKIGTAVSLAAGAFAAGMTGMPNYALQIFNQASADDLQRQKENKNSLYNKFITAGADVKQAEDLVEAFQIKAFAAKMEDAARATTNAKAKIELQQNAIKLYSEGLKREAEADAEAAKAEYDRARAKSEPERLKLDQEKALNDQIKMLADIANDKSRSENDRQRALAALLSASARAAGVGAGAGRAAAPASGTEDKVEIGGELVTPLRGKSGIGEVQDQIAGRNTVTREALALSQLFKEQGNNIWNLDNPARDLARAKLSLLIENYPKAVGFKRAISLNAAKKLEQALDNPTGFFSAFRNFFGDRPPSTAIDALYDSIRLDRDDYLTQKLGSGVYNKDLRAKLYAEDRSMLPVQTVKLGGQ